MPRIEFDHPDIDKFCEETSRGSSLFDLCKECFSQLETAGEMFGGKDTTGDNGDPIPASATIQETGPDASDFIDEADYCCDHCDVLLTSLNY